MCDFLEEIARHKLFRLISSGNRSPQTFSAHFLRKSLATNFFGPFPQEIARYKTFSAHFLRKSAATNFFGSFPQEIGRHKTFSAHFLRKSAATNFFGSFPQEIGRHKLFRPISSGNRRMAYIELTLK